MWCHFEVMISELYVYCILFVMFCVMFNASSFLCIISSEPDFLISSDLRSSPPAFHGICQDFDNWM